MRYRVEIYRHGPRAQTRGSVFPASAAANALLDEAAARTLDDIVVIRRTNQVLVQLNATSDDRAAALLNDINLFSPGYHDRTRDPRKLSRMTQIRKFRCGEKE